MKTIKIKIDYPEEYEINGEYKAKGVTEMTWFPFVDLTIKIKDKEFVFQGASDCGEYYLPSKTFEIV